MRNGGICLIVKEYLDCYNLPPIVELLFSRFSRARSTFAMIRRDLPQQVAVFSLGDGWTKL